LAGDTVYSAVRLLSRRACARDIIIIDRPDRPRSIVAPNRNREKEMAT